MTTAFLNYLRAQVGCIYVWGGQGQREITEEWIRKRETSEANANRAVRLWRKRRAEGASPLAAYDCSGLIVHFLLEQGLISSDMSSRGLYSACEKLTRSDLAPGDLVFRHNGERIYHVGVYMGDGEVIEAKGRDDGVVCRDINAGGNSYWNRYGRLPQLAAARPPRPEQPGPAGERGYFPAEYSYTGGSYVNLRTGPGQDCEAIGRVSRGERVLALAAENGWAEVIKKDGKYIRGWCADRHLARE